MTQLDYVALYIILFINVIFVLCSFFVEKKAFPSKKKYYYIVIAFLNSLIVFIYNFISYYSLNGYGYAMEVLIDSFYATITFLALYVIMFIAAKKINIIFNSYILFTFSFLIIFLFALFCAFLVLIELML